MVRKVLLIMALFIMMFLFAGCQAVQGFGRDITWTGEAVENVLEGSY